MDMGHDMRSWKETIPYINTNLQNLCILFSTLSAFSNLEFCLLPEDEEVQRRIRSAFADQRSIDYVCCATHKVRKGVLASSRLVRKLYSLFEPRFFEKFGDRVTLLMVE